MGILFLPCVARNLSCGVIVFVIVIVVIGGGVIVVGISGADMIPFSAGGLDLLTCDLSTTGSNGGAGKDCTLRRLQ